MDKKFTRAAEKLKEQAADAIRDIMKKKGLTEIDASVADVPTVCHDPNDANLSYVLVEIFMRPDDGELNFYTANTCDDASFSVKELSTDTLCAIADWLAEKHIDVTFEYGRILPDGESGTAEPTPEQTFDRKWPERPSVGSDRFKEYIDDLFSLYEQTGFADTFRTEYSDRLPRNGETFDVVRRARAEDGVEEEQMPMWLIKFDDDTTTLAYPEEITKMIRENKPNE